MTHFSAKWYWTRWLGKRPEDQLCDHPHGGGGRALLNSVGKTCLRNERKVTHTILKFLNKFNTLKIKKTFSRYDH
jgi:hypothetical protein